MGRPGRRSPDPVAVTGASGMLGRHLCRLLSRRGWRVRALVRDPAAFSEEGVEVGRCALPEEIDESLLEGASALVHCAYATREVDPAKAERVNEEGTRRILEASRRAGVRRFVFISSLVAHAAAPSYYGRSKFLLEGLLDPSRDLVVRPGLILARQGEGLFQQMRETIRRAGWVPVFGGGKQPLQTVHVDDLCEGLARALERDLTGALNVAEADPVSMSVFLRMLADRLGIRCTLVPLPLGLTIAGVRIAEALRVPLPIRSESLLGLKALRRVPVEADLSRLELNVRTAAESLEDVVEIS
ncbi:MAG: NAD-dependent epimerase/dehydratase family protein [Myxococcota bacterium]